MEKFKWFLVFLVNPAMTISFACRIVPRMLQSYCTEFVQYGLPKIFRRRK